MSHAVPAITPPHVTTTPENFEYTFAWWHNAQLIRKKPVGGKQVEVTHWHKHLSHGGEIGQFAYGSTADKPQFFGGRCARSTEEQHDKYRHQIAIVCSPTSRLFVVDVDDPVKYSMSHVAQLLDRGSATTVRGQGWHTHVYVPPELNHRWPKQGVIPGGDIKSNGYVPAPGCWHYSGEQYQHVLGSHVIIATDKLLDAIDADRAVTLKKYGDTGNRGDGNDPELFSYTGTLVALGLKKEEAWEKWLALAQTLPLSEPDWPWTEQNRDRFEHHWQYCSDAHEMNHPDDLIAAVAVPETRTTGPVPAPPSPPDLVSVPDTPDEGPTDGESGTQPPQPPVDSSPFGLLQPEDVYQLPAGYHLIPEGVTWVHEVGHGKAKKLVTDLIAMRPLLLTTALVDEQGDTRYELAWLSDGDERRTIVVGTRDVSDRTRLLAVFPEVVVTSSTTTAVVEYLAQTLVVNRESLFRRRDRVATALGWFDEKATTFVGGPGRPLTVKDSKNTGPWLKGHRAGGSLQGWTDAVRACSDRPVVQVLVSAAFAAPLLRLLGAASFVVDVSSSTSQGKTISQWLSAAAWGNPDLGIVETWQSTTVALEHYLSMLRGMPFYLSESQLARDGVVETFVYALVEGHSKGRSRQDGSGLVDQVNWEAVPISSGERPLTSFTKKGGVVPRVITLTGSPFSSAETADAARDAARENFGHAGPRFVEELLRLERDSLREAFKNWVKVLRTTAVTAVAKRRAESVAVLALANQLAARWDLVPEIRMETWAWLVAGGGANLEGEDDRPRQALDVVLRAVAFNPLAFYRQGSMMGDIPPSGGWVGRYEPGQFVAFRPEWLRKQLTEEGYDYDTVVAEWREREWLLTVPGRMTRSTAINGRNTRVVYVVEGVAEIENYVVTDAVIEELLDGDVGP